MIATPPPSAPLPKRHGVYCLANDAALEWFEAFVRSFRKHNPDLPLTVIPYDTSMARLKALRARFQFEVMEESEASRFDAIAHRVAGQRIAGGTFRKLCTFFGEYETFLFLDSDIVVTQPLEPFFDAFEKAEADFIYFDTDMTMVYTPDFARKMMTEFGSTGFNSGASSRF
jgi:lipopolysaccharide biosynthesis glycosyltransferase